MASTISNSAQSIARARVNEALDLIPGAYHGQAEALFNGWATAVGTDREMSEAQTVVDEAFRVAERTGYWSTVDAALATLFAEESADVRWTTTDGTRFGADGVIRPTTPAPRESEDEQTATDAPAPVVATEVGERIALALERIAIAMESTNL